MNKCQDKFIKELEHIGNLTREVGMPHGSEED